MGKIKKYIFKKNKNGEVLNQNLFIGGIGVSTTTPLLLSGILGISESEISNFVIINNDIACNIANDYNLPAEAFRFNYEITFFIDEEKCTSVGSNAFNEYSAPYNLEYVLIQNATILGSQCFYISQSDKVVEIILPSATSYSSTRGFRALPLMQNCYIPKIINLGNNTLYNEVFLQDTSILTVYANPIMETINGGLPDGDLSYVTDTLGGIVRYVQNYILPSEVNNLSSSNITTTSVDLSFTIPSSTNTISYYEVYVDDGSGFIARDKIRFDKVINSGDALIGLSSSTSYKIKLRTVDIYFNRSVFSNEITITTI